MRILSAIYLITGLLFANPSNANDTLKVFACEPEWASITSRIGGDKVEIFTAKKAIYNSNSSPLLIEELKKSDLVICSGAVYEPDWLSSLIKNSTNIKIQSGKIGFLEVSSKIPPLEKPSYFTSNKTSTKLKTKKQIQLNPHNITIVAREVFLRLAQINLQDKKYYQKNYEEFSQEWALAMARWEKRAASLRGTPIIAQNESFTYLANWLGLVVVAEIEQEGTVKPSSKHIEELIKNNVAHPSSLIIREIQDDVAASTLLSEKTGITPIVLPITIGENGQIIDLFRLFDNIITILKQVTSERSKNLNR